MIKIINRVGEKHLTNEGYTIEIIEYFRKDNCTVRFEDGTIITNVQYEHIKGKGIKNPNHKSVLRVGYIGVGKYKTRVQNKLTKHYTYWQNILIRCYDEKQSNKRPTYERVTVCKEWHNFQVFAKWFDENYIDNWALDKDILVKGNKIYSPETCCFVPQEVNNLFTKSNSKRGDYPIGVYEYKSVKYKALIRKNDKLIYLGLYNTPEEAFQAYKIEKEKYIKQKADKWKDKICPRVYEAMYKYEVEITD